MLKKIARDMRRGMMRFSGAGIVLGELRRCIGTLRILIDVLTI